MASRFKIVENENTKNSTEYWKNGFEKWANESNFQALEEYDSDVFDQTLSQICAFRNSVILTRMLLTSNRPMRLPIGGVVEAIGHFRTYFCLYFKASQSGKSLL